MWNLNVDALQIIRASPLDFNEFRHTTKVTVSYQKGFLKNLFLH